MIIDGSFLMCTIFRERYSEVTLLGVSARFKDLHDLMICNIQASEGFARCRSIFLILCSSGQCLYDVYIAGTPTQWR
jgi:hypothetical protein